MKYIIITHSILILYIIYHLFIREHIHITLNRSDILNTILGTSFYWRGHEIWYIPFRNEDKVNLDEKIKDLILRDARDRRQQLHAIFSWLYTDVEVEKFRSDYNVVDSEYVSKLIDNKMVTDAL